MSFPAYNRGNKHRPFPPINHQQNQSRNEPPEILPTSPMFRANPSSFQRSLDARQQDQRELQVRRILEERIRAEQEKTSYGIKQVNLDDFDEDDDIVPMAPVNSLLNPQPQVIVKEVHHYIDRPKKKRKKRSPSSSSSESSHKKKKKKKRRHHSSDDETSLLPGEGTSQIKRSRNKQESIYDASKNNWKLLKKNEYKYQPSHLVIDCKSDFENLKYEQPYKHEVADYRSVQKPGTNIHIISERFKELLSEPQEFSITNEERFFSNKIIKMWGRHIERTFRNKESNFQDFIPLSHQPCGKDDGGASIVKIEDENFDQMDINDYEHSVKSKQVSYQESLLGTNIKDRYSVLHNKVNSDKENVEAWLEFVDIQRTYHASEESGDPEAPIQNQKAYYERVMEILRKAIIANQANADLQIKRLEIMENYYGVTSPEVKNEWQRLENRLLNNVKMWEGNLKMRMNDRSTFELKKTIEHIDKCTDKLVRIKYGIMKSHPYLEGTDEFLVDLLITRCRLLIAAGFLDKAIGMLQALAEFHFFRHESLDNETFTPLERWENARNEFKEFWESCTHRIGEVSALGWCNYKDENGCDYGEKEQWIENERDTLESDLVCFRSAEQTEVKEYKRHGYSLIETRRRLEKFRTRYYWQPVHHKYENYDLYMYESRIVTFKEVKPVLFHLNNNDLARDLIYKLLHIFGVSIPGLEFTSQEDILRVFSPKLFPSSRPNAFKLEEFQMFIELFIQLLTDSKHMDPARICAAQITSIANSSLGRVEKAKKMKNFARKQLSTECQFAIWTFVFDELAKLQDTKETEFAIQVCLKLLRINLDEKNISIWDIGKNVEDSVKRSIKNRERIFYLRFFAFIVRNLPFSDEQGAYEKFNGILVKDDTGQCLKTKREFLLNLWIHGKVSEIEETPENIREAQQKVTKHLKSAAPKDQEDLKLRWIGNEYEIIFELAALFFYEFPLGERAQRYKFFREDKPLFTSELAKSLSDTSACSEVRVNVLQHITRVCNGLEITPSNLVRVVSQQVQRFPHSIPLLKALLDVSNGFNQRRFLDRNPGNDELTRLIRDCGRLYAERIRLDVDLETEKAQNEKETRTMIGRIVAIFRKIAERHSDHLMPDDYIWFVLIRMMVDTKETISFRMIDEVFILGQKVCPWSKALLFEAARERPTSDNSFLNTLNSSIRSHGLSEYITDKEVQLLMTDQIF